MTLTERIEKLEAKVNRLGKEGIDPSNLNRRLEDLDLRFKDLYVHLKELERRVSHLEPREDSINLSKYAQR